MARKTFKTGFGAADPPASRQRPHGTSHTSWRTNLAAPGEPETWCGRRVSNPHDLRHGNLNPARLPVPPRPQVRYVRETATSAGRTRRRMRPREHRTADPEALRHGNAPSRKRPIGDARSGTRTIEVRPHAHGCARMDRVAAYIMTARACSNKMAPSCLLLQLPGGASARAGDLPASLWPASAGPAKAEIAAPGAQMNGGKPLALFSATYEGPRTLPGDAA